MSTPLEIWAREERAEIITDIKWLNAGATLTSPSGDDITKMKIGQLTERLTELEAILRGLTSA